MLKTKVGYSTLKDSYAQGKETAKNACLGMRPKLGMLYCSCLNDVEETVRGAMNNMKGAPVIGCTSSGMIMTNDGIITSEDGFSGMMTFDDKMLISYILYCYLLIPIYYHLFYLILDSLNLLLLTIYIIHLTYKFLLSFYRLVAITLFTLHFK